MDLDIRTERPKKPAKYAFVVGGGDVKGWRPLSAEDREQRARDEARTRERMAEAWPSQVKSECHKRITACLPEWKQANMNARAFELLAKGEANWSTEETDEITTIQSRWAWIASMRAKSDEIEKLGPNGANLAEDATWAIT